MFENFTKILYTIIDIFLTVYEYGWRIECIIWILTKLTAMCFSGAIP